MVKAQTHYEMRIRGKSFRSGSSRSNSAQVLPLASRYAAACSQLLTASALAEQGAAHLDAGAQSIADGFLHSFQSSFIGSEVMHASAAGADCVLQHQDAAGGSFYALDDGTPHANQLGDLLLDQLHAAALRQLPCQPPLLL